MSIKESNLITVTSTDVTTNDYVRILDGNVSRKMTFGEFLNFLTSNASFVEIEGDTMTGNLVVQNTANANIKIEGLDISPASITIQGSTASYAAIELGDVTDPNIGEIRYDNTTDSLSITVNTLESITVDSAGDVVFNYNANVVGTATLATAVVSNLTDNRVVIAGTAGALEDDANLTFNGSTLTVGVNLDVNGTALLDDTTFDAGAVINAGANKITNVAEPVASTDAVTKNYVDTGAAATIIYNDGAVINTFGSNVGVGGDRSSFGLPSTTSMSGQFALLSGGYDYGPTTYGDAYIVNLLTGNIAHQLHNPNVYSTEYQDDYGTSNDIDGEYSIVGAPGEKSAAGNNVGAAYIFSNRSGLNTITLTNPNNTAEDDFGTRVAISGRYCAVYAEGRGTGTAQGVVYIYDVLDGSLFRTVTEPTPADNSRFGLGLAMQGNKLAIGCAADTIYIYDLSTNTFDFTKTNPGADSLFGYYLDMDDTNIIVGAPNETVSAQDYAGTAYVYDIATGALVYTLTDATPTAYNYFGRDVAISGDYFAVGVSGVQSGSAGAGYITIYDTATGNLLTTSVATPADATKAFGSAVAMSGNRIIGSTLKFSGPYVTLDRIYQVATKDLNQLDVFAAITQKD